MKKLRIETITVILTIIIFSTGIFLFKQWSKTEIYANNTCKHFAWTKAELVRKAPIGVCGWLLEGEPRMEEHWFNCDKYEIGDVIDWEYTNYDCDDYIKTF